MNCFVTGLTGFIGNQCLDVPDGTLCGEVLLRVVPPVQGSVFHRAFKDVLGEPPLQYLKQMRLNTARNRITCEGQPVRLAAESVGYESTSQLSREFKRYFGVSSSRARELPYSSLVGVRSNA